MGLTGARWLLGFLKPKVFTFFVFVISPRNEGYKTSLVSPWVVDFIVVFDVHTLMIPEA